MEQAFDPSILVFAALAVFVLWKLHSVLGVRSERDASAPPRNRFSPSKGGLFGPRPAAPAPAALDAERWTGLAEQGSKAWAGLDAIAATDPSFTRERFIEGARKAYEMIVSAFAKGDRDTLRRLLSSEVYDNFAREIASREANGESVETSVVAIDDTRVEDASSERGVNNVTLRFAVKLLTTRRDREGKLIGGEEHPVSIVDLWTFARAPASRDPNWRLVATESLH
ncbi:preprotein translocase subunit Tim44 [Methylocystis bryophila]|uniref:Preprotein translocase subunit Tim44 n=1 Tax=Methylocystis bryophila TaxID=655015 RepID=A0A1W6N1I0_9HYPH|nr:preprotein translocase subunit Tim44 [Methylocystis bryophila]